MHVIKGHFEPILLAMKKESEKSAIQMAEFTMITDLPIKDGVCQGTVGIDIQNKLLIFRAESTFLAACFEMDLGWHEVQFRCNQDGDRGRF